MRFTAKKSVWLLVLLFASSFALPVGGAETPSAASKAALPLVKVLATGGTIVNLGGTTKNFEGLSGQKLVDSVPDIAKYARVEVEQVVNLPSSRLDQGIWLVLAKRINQIFSNEPEVAGIVITHGTDTMEETTYFLNLTVKSKNPVVVTGAMISASYKDTDGPRNLISAVRIAAAPGAQGKGALLLSNEREIFAARDITKTNTVRVDAFGGGEFGILGYVDEDGVWFYHQPVKKHTYASEFDVSKLEKLPLVEIISSYAGAPGYLVDALLAHQVKGIVIAGTGAGGSTPAIIDAANRAIKDGVTVVTSTRVSGGRTRGRSVDVGIRGDNLNPQKARILLMLALSKTSDPKEIQRMFDEY